MKLIRKLFSVCAIVGLLFGYMPVTNVQAISCPTSRPSDPVSYWNLDEGSGIIAEDPRGLSSFNLVNSPTWVAGKVGSNALSFDTTNYAESPAKTWGFSNTGTISMWIKTTDSNQAVFSLGRDQADDEMLMYTYGGKIAIFSEKSLTNFAYRASDTSVNTGQWVHVVGVMDGGFGSSNMRIYVNGHEETGVYGTSGTPALLSDATPRSVRLARRVWGTGFVTSEFYNGQVDDVRVFNRALSTSEIKALYILDSGGCGSISGASDTQSNQANSTASNHTISFTTPGGVEAGQSITLTFPVGFTIPGALDYTDIDLSASTGGARTLAATPSGSTWGVLRTGQSIRLLSGTDAITAGDTVTIKIGTNATVGTTGDQQIVNAATPDGYILEVGSTFGEVGNIPISVIGPNCIDPSPGLVSWWSADNHTGDAHDANPGTLVNGAGFTTGKVGSAFNLDGLNDYVRVPSAANINLSTSNFSLDSWVKIASHTNSTGVPTYEEIQTIISKRNDTAPYNGFILYLFNGVVGFAISDGTNNAYNPSLADLSDNLFHHIVLSVNRSSATGGKIFIDGVDVYTFNPTGITGSIDSANDLLIGVDNQNAAQVLQGQIDEVKVYNTALTAAQVIGEYNAGASGVCKPSTLLTGRKDTLSREKGATAADHTIQFTTPSGVPEDATMTFTFPSDFATSMITEDDVDVQDDGVDLTTAADCSGSEKASVTMSDQVLTVTICNGDGGAIAGGSVVTVKIGAHATVSGTGTHQIINPSVAGSYKLSIAGTFGDTGALMIPIADSDQSSESGRVDPSITFDIDASVTDTDTSAPYSVQLGQISTTDSRVSGTTDGVKYIWLDLATNASGGAVVKVANAHGANGLVSTGDPAAKIDSTDGAIANGTVRYGLCVVAVTQSAGTLAKASPYNSGTCVGNSETNDVQGLTTTGEDIVNTSSAPVLGGRTQIAVNASVSNTTPGKNDYADSLTFIATGTF